MGNSRFHMIFGLAMLVLGSWLAWSQSFYVVDLLKGSGPPFLIWAGMFIIFYGLNKTPRRIFVMAIGAAVLANGVYGLFDEWMTVVDCSKGFLPLAFIVGGLLAVATGVRVLKS